MQTVTGASVPVAAEDRRLLVLENPHMGCFLLSGFSREVTQQGEPPGTRRLPDAILDPAALAYMQIDMQQHVDGTVRRRRDGHDIAFRPQRLMGRNDEYYGMRRREFVRIPGLPPPFTLIW